MLLLLLIGKNESICHINHYKNDSNLTKNLMSSKHSISDTNDHNFKYNDMLYKHVQWNRKEIIKELNNVSKNNEIRSKINKNNQHQTRRKVLLNRCKECLKVDTKTSINLSESNNQHVKQINTASSSNEFSKLKQYLKLFVNDSNILGGNRTNVGKKQQIFNRKTFKFNKGKAKFRNFGKFQSIESPKAALSISSRLMPFSLRKASVTNLFTPTITISGTTIASSVGKTMASSIGKTIASSLHTITPSLVNETESFARLKSETILRSTSLLTPSETFTQSILFLQTTTTRMENYTKSNGTTSSLLSISGPNYPTLFHANEEKRFKRHWLLANISSLTTQSSSSMITSAWPVKHAAIVEGDIILGGLMMVHSREDTITCGPIMPQGGIQALEAMLYTLDVINERKLLPSITLGAHVLDDCDKDTYGLEMAVDFIKGK